MRYLPFGFVALAIPCVLLQAAIMVSGDGSVTVTKTKVVDGILYDDLEPLFTVKKPVQVANGANSSTVTHQANYANVNVKLVIKDFKISGQNVAITARILDGEIPFHKLSKKQFEFFGGFERTPKLTAEDAQQLKTLLEQAKGKQTALLGMIREDLTYTEVPKAYTESGAYDSMQIPAGTELRIAWAIGLSFRQIPQITFKNSALADLTDWQIIQDSKAWAKGE